MRGYIIRLYNNKVKNRCSNLSSTQYIVGKHPSGRSEHCHKLETAHVFLTCRQYSGERKPIIKAPRKLGMVDGGEKGGRKEVC